eukprot:CAMPEP_0114148738 /NCGR_PEP_ID=MMETSP0043_2-20121206/21791_1 /TAXON_ID=464988 /ORGANISM="Hemiselmis andersenii, Strain CCMP644" /LENGTH=317 /DNA_ID=CAMNT_0001243345 /DNA_START=13 /DNA_END=963 /DNA_ORIENTATION=+
MDNPTARMPNPPPAPRPIGARPNLPQRGVNGVLTRAQILSLGEQARDGIHLAHRNFHRKNPLLPEDTTSLMILPSDYIEERRLRDEAEQASLLAAAQGLPPPAAGSPKPPPKKVKKQQQKSLLKGLKGKRTVSVSLDQGRAIPRPPASADTPSTRLAAVLAKGMSISTPSSIRKTPSGRRPRSAGGSAGRGGFFGEDEDEDDPAFHLRNESVKHSTFRDAGVGGVNFCPQSARARASRVGVPRGNLVMQHSALALGRVEWDAPEKERREAERGLHSLHAQAVEEALAFAGDLDLWPSWFEQLPYASARKVCRHIVSL